MGRLLSAQYNILTVVSASCLPTSPGSSPLLSGLGVCRANSIIMVSYIPIALVKARLELLSFVSQCLHQISEHRMYNIACVLRRELMPQLVFHNACTYKCILPYFSSNNVGVERFELPVRLSSRFQSESAPNYRFRPRNSCVLSSAVILSVIHKHRLVGTASFYSNTNLFGPFLFPSWTGLRTKSL